MSHGKDQTVKPLHLRPIQEFDPIFVARLAGITMWIMHQWLDTKLTQFLDNIRYTACLLYTSDAADERSSVDLGGRRIIKKKKIVK